jgi:outer membrane protein OmpA-like peptidoglycan-associated protein
VIVDLSALDRVAPKAKPVKQPRAAQAPAPTAEQAPAPAPAAPAVPAKPAPVKKPPAPAKPPAAEASAPAPAAASPAAVAALPPKPAPAPGQATARAEANASASIPDNIAPATRLNFAAGSEEMDAAASALVDALVAENGSGARVVQVRAYAAGSGETNSAARRLSLKRAVAVRSYMIHKGMQAARIDVRALGPAPDAGPADRVDIVIMP